MRIARCIAETWLQSGRLSGAAHALTLARTVDLRLWDNSKMVRVCAAVKELFWLSPTRHPSQICRQFTGIGKVR